jgi:outer membrane lipoprotein-sorting protein
MNIKAAALFFLLAFTTGLFAQEIVTADNYLSQVSQVYSGFRDYEAQIAIKTGNNTQAGAISHKAPSFLRIDFSSPPEQALVFNGEELLVYLPDMRAVLSQTVASRSGGNAMTQAGGGAGLATSEGLAMMRRNYAAAYVSGPDPIPLDETPSGSQEMVIKLRLTRRFSGGFRQLTLSINPDTKYIRRIEGQTTAGAQVAFDFTGIKVNQGIPEQRFIYTAPANANQYNNFLTRDAEQ